MGEWLATAGGPRVALYEARALPPRARRCRAFFRVPRRPGG